LYDEGVFSIRDLLRSTDDHRVIQTKLREVIGKRAKDGFEAEKQRSTHINESMTTIGG
jgi:cyclic pyranopterin phosphate synthase